MSAFNQVLCLEENSEMLDSSLLFANRTNVRCKRGSVEQKAHLLNFLENDTYFAQDRYEGVEGRRIQNEKWQQLATELNNIEGARKNGQEWRKYWRDLVLRTKARAQEFHANARREPMQRKALKPFSAEELQIIKILTCNDPKSNTSNEVNKQNNSNVPGSSCEIKDEPQPTPSSQQIDSSSGPKIVNLRDLVTSSCSLVNNSNVPGSSCEIKDEPQPTPSSQQIDSSSGPKIVNLRDLVTSSCSLENLQPTKSNQDINGVNYVLGDSPTQITNMEEFQNMIDQKYTPSQNSTNATEPKPRQPAQQCHSQQHHHSQSHPLIPPPIMTAIPSSNMSSTPIHGSTNNIGLENMRRKKKQSATLRLLKWAERKFDDMEAIESKKMKLMEERNDILRQIASNIKEISEKLNSSR